MIPCSAGEMIVPIPFWKSSSVGSVADLLQSEQKLVAAREAASSAIGHIIAMRDAICSPLTKAYMEEYLSPLIDCRMKRVYYLAKDGYAWFLVAARLVCETGPL